MCPTFAQVSLIVVVALLDITEIKARDIFETKAKLVCFFLVQNESKIESAPPYVFLSKNMLQGSKLF